MSKLTYSDTGAEISVCRRYRYTLRRAWTSARATSDRAVCWVMLNPSTADAAVDDPTIRRCVRFTDHWGYRSLIVVNLFAYRTKSPRRMMAELEPVGAGNDDAITSAALSAGMVVCAWGIHGTHLGRGEEVRRLLQSIGCTPMALGRSEKNGEPLHPLFQPYGAKLQPLAAVSREAVGA